MVSVSETCLEKQVKDVGQKVLAFLPDNFFSLVCDLAPCEGKEGRLVVRQEDDDGEEEEGSGSEV